MILTAFWTMQGFVNCLLQAMQPKSIDMRGMDKGHFAPIQPRGPKKGCKSRDQPFQPLAKADVGCGGIRGNYGTEAGSPGPCSSFSFSTSLISFAPRNSYYGKAVVRSLRIKVARRHPDKEMFASTFGATGKLAINFSVYVVIMSNRN